MFRKRVYSPDNEPFDLTEAKANELVLQHGWSQTPHDPTAEPAVRVVARTEEVAEVKASESRRKRAARGPAVRASAAATEAAEQAFEEWRGIDADAEVAA